jgi:POT family proton-dependent oligopeptide transporter
MLVLFMSAALASGGFGFDRTVASAIVGIYAGSVYLASLPGGWIADRWLGLRRAIWYGGLFIALGHISIATSVILGRPAFFVGLIFIVMGTGLLKPNISAIVGDLYPEGGARRDAGFSIFYMGINLGATLGPLITAFLRVRAGWHIGFGAAGVGMLAGVITYRLRAGSTLGSIGVSPTGTPEQQRLVKRVVFGALADRDSPRARSRAFCQFAVALAEQMRNIELGMAVLYSCTCFFAKLAGDELKRVAVIAVLFVFATIFWRRSNRRRRH